MRRPDQHPGRLGTVGGTSLSSPLWSGIAADRTSFQGRRIGNRPRPGYDLATGIGTPDTTP